MADEATRRAGAGQLGKALADAEAMLADGERALGVGQRAVALARYEEARRGVGGQPLAASAAARWVSIDRRGVRLLRSLYPMVSGSTFSDEKRLRLAQDQQRALDRAAAAHVPAWAGPAAGATSVRSTVRTLRPFLARYFEIQAKTNHSLSTRLGAALAGRTLGKRLSESDVILAAIAATSTEPKRLPRGRARTYAPLADIPRIVKAARSSTPSLKPPRKQQIPSKVASAAR